MGCKEPQGTPHDKWSQRYGHQQEQESHSLSRLSTGSSEDLPRPSSLHPTEEVLLPWVWPEREGESEVERREGEGGRREGRREGRRGEGGRV